MMVANERTIGTSTTWALILGLEDIDKPQGQHCLTHHRRDTRMQQRRMGSTCTSSEGMTPPIRMIYSASIQTMVSGINWEGVHQAVPALNQMQGIDAAWFITAPHYTYLADTMVKAT